VRDVLVVRLALISLVIIAAAVLSPTASPSPAPTTRSCVRAWNEPANAAGRETLVTTGPWAATVQPGTTTTGPKTAVTRSRPAPRCLLLLARGPVRVVVTGVWDGDQVVTWRFGPRRPASAAAPAANVAILADGRLRVR
jgi:hypothetical protein